MTKAIFEALASGDTLELRMYGPIGGYYDGITAKNVSEALANAPNAKSIRIRMSSPGGAAFEGMAIRSMLAAHTADVSVDVEGLSASAASIIAMAAKTIRMHAGSALMIHEASTVTAGDAKEHERSMHALEVLNDGMANIYAARCGKSVADCRKMMSDETWMTPEQAVSNGLANEVIKGKSAAPAAFAFDLNAFGYRHVPPQLAAFTAQAKAAQSEEEERPNMTINFARIAQAVGLAPDAEEAAVLSALGKINAVLSELRAITAADSNDGILGATRAFAEAHKQLPGLRAKLEEQGKAMEASERAQLLAADASDPKGRKLTPAMVTFWAERPVGELKAFLAVAPHVVAVTATAQPQVTGSVTGHSTAAAPAVLLHEGKTYEQMAPKEKVSLHQSAPEIYAALRNNWEERGKPGASKSQTERASA